MIQRTCRIALVVMTVAVPAAGQKDSPAPVSELELGGGWLQWNLLEVHDLVTFPSGPSGVSVEGHGREHSGGGGGGRDAGRVSAVRLRVAEQYVEKLGVLAKENVINDTMIVPIAVGYVSSIIAEASYPVRRRSAPSRAGEAHVSAVLPVHPLRHCILASHGKTKTYCVLVALTPILAPIAAGT